jgi:hypothetical protein
VVKTIECDMSYLEFYNKCIEADSMKFILNLEGVEIGGLCDYYTKWTFGQGTSYDPLFELMIPTDSDRAMLRLEGKSTFTWAGESNVDLFYEFTPLRQNIVLLMAAMAGEL